MKVGQRIRQLRTKNNLTQEELASRCELTKGYLSQLENDLATPSLPTLQDIVVALGTNMSQFFKEDERQEKVTFEESDFFVDEKDGYTIRWIVPNAQKNEMEPILVEIQPGESSQPMQPHEGEEFGYVLGGRISLVNGKEEYPLKKGETFYIRGDYEHILRNTGSHTAQILWICTPPMF
ncbi:MAG: helix-turn-helix transcriptional regulator [Stomatobaculum sp.]|nr:helix-turn-helix transcriptional regulator [Stomatobaculum sp.]